MGEYIYVYLFKGVDHAGLAFSQAKRFLATCRQCLLTYGRRLKGSLRSDPTFFKLQINHVHLPSGKS